MYDVFALEKPVYCRCGAEIVVSILKDQWFIDYGNEKWKSLARKCLSEMEIIPEIYRKLFEDTIEWLHERPAARKRGLGTKLPFDKEWIIESLSDSTIYMAFYTVIHHIRENKIPPEKLTLEFWDYVLLGKGKLNEISTKTGINEELLKKMRNEFNYWYPVDLRHTAIAHITNHLTFYIFNHAAIFPEEKWPRRITLNNLLIREGRKMSKSLGNVIPLAEVPKKYGADLLRFYMAYGADLSSVVDFRESEVMSLRNKLQQFYNLVISSKNEDYKEDNATRWLISRFNKHLKAATEAIEDYSPRTYVQNAFFNVLNDITYFTRRSTNKGVLREKIFPMWLKILAPVIPHLCEELWENLGNSGFISTESWPKYNEEEIDEESEIGEEEIKNLLSDINNVIKLVGKEPNNIKLFVSENWKYKLYSIIKDEIESGNRDMKSLIEKAMKEETIKRHGKETMNIIKKTMKSRNIQFIPKEKELEILDEAKTFFENEFGCKFEIIDSENSNEPKSKQALPNKPAILVE
jgi:leucyl-tRNA synthetase